MLRATRALSAMLTLGAFACSFEHTGLLPGAADADVADSPGTDDRIATDGREGAAGSDGDFADGGTDTGQDDSSPDADVAADSPTRPDGPTPANDAVAYVEAGADGATDGSVSGPDARIDCAAVAGGVMFTPPGGANAHCYWPHATAANWLGAANACRAEGGHLVTLASSAETTFVLGLVTPFPSTDRIWIGATDGRFSSDGPGSGPFIWITGEPMTYQNWANNGPTQQPDGKCNTCAGAPCECEHRVAMQSDGRWEDLYEALFYRFVCEAEL
jgi:Lectin C-type domain